MNIAWRRRLRNRLEYFRITPLQLPIHLRVEHLFTRFRPKTKQFFACNSVADYALALVLSSAHPALALGPVWMTFAWTPSNT
jgi:hypothetical protein